MPADAPALPDHAVPDGIAIVGMAGRFPGAPDVDALWSNLCQGVESIRSYTDDELRAAGAPTSDPAFVNAGAAMEGIEEFDAAFFGMSRREAELTDPQHRLVLETAWATLEHAGYEPGVAAGRIGLFGGVAVNLYYRYNLRSHPELLARVGDVPLLLATEREYAITRAAYKLGLEGPAVSVNTACSTSAVAAHLAVQSLLAGDTDLALAGGAYVRLPARAGYLYEEDGILSADGHVRAFDADARGTVMASGVAFVALKRIADALADGDTVYAVIRGSAINNDGADRISFTAPGVVGQEAVITEALAIADVDAGSIGFVEAHGTGTSLGDPIEIAALAQAYRRHTDRRQYCAIGSLKSNLGHLDAAAGVTGIIKAALSLYHEVIPPSINFRTPNPQIDFESSPFFVNTELRAWKRGTEPRRAGVSSFGFGGTNAHIVLEEAPMVMPAPHEPPDAPRILTLSAKTPEALDRRRRQLADHLAAHPGTDLDDVAYTLAVGRARLAHRAAIVATDMATAIGSLRGTDAGVTATRSSTLTGGEIAFLFTGQGAQYPGMGAGLYRTEPVFAAAMRECAGILGDIDGHDLVDLLYGDHADQATTQSPLLRTSIGQPAILALQYALSRLWASWGIEPAAMVGHSVGEIAAACIGGVLTLEEALRLAATRGRLMQELPVGAMTAVLAEESVVLPLLDDDTSLAAVNAPEQCVASGPPVSIEGLERRLEALGVSFRRLPTDRAFHSPMMDPAVGPLRDHVERLARGDLRIPMVSTVTGDWTSPAALADPGYWAIHARRTVRFADAVGVLLSQRPATILLEVGPGETLTSLVRQHPGASSETVVMSTLPGRSGKVADEIHARRALADVWAAGGDVDRTALTGRRRRISLPTYPFARDRYWIEDQGAAARATAGGVASVATAATGTPARPTAPTAPARPVAVTAGNAPAALPSRRERIAGRISACIADLSGLDAATLDRGASFVDLGFDSLFLTQANAQFRKQFGVRTTLGQLLGETPTIDTLATRIDSELAPDDDPVPAGPASDSSSAGGPAAETAMELPTAPFPNGDGDLPPDQIAWFITEQLRIMEQQLRLLGSHVADPDPDRATAAARSD